MDKRTVKLVMIVAMLLTVALYFIGGTYARYISEFEGKGTATVAAWKVQVGGKAGTDQKQTELPVEFTIEKNEFVVNGKIAPATKLTGKIEVDLTGTEVAVDLSAKIDNTKLTEALQKYTGLSTDFEVTEPTISKALSSSYDGEISGGTINLNDNTAFTELNGKFDITFSIEWKDNEENDASATKLGVAAQNGSTTIEVPVTISAKQHIANP